MSKIKIAVYAICKNEEKFIDRWMNSILPELGDDDNIVVFDTGSSDKSVELFEKYDDRVIVRFNSPIEPFFRFDVARNTALNDVPENIDVCIKSDLDEVFHPGWRAAIEKVWIKGVLPQRCRANFIWNHDEHGKPDRVFQHDCMIHSRYGYVWKNACHEVIVPTTSSELINNSDVTFEHFADNTKPRSNYLNLLNVDVEENPNDSRVVLYYARELWFVGDYINARTNFMKFLGMPNTWNVERCFAYRVLSKIAVSMEAVSTAEEFLKKACDEAPEQREPWIEAAELATNPHYKLFAAEQALKTTSRPQHYLSESRCWGSLPYDLAALGAYYSGSYALSLHYALAALAFDPLDKRLQSNVAMIKSKLENL